MQKLKLGDVDSSLPYAHFVGSRPSISHPSHNPLFHDFVILYCFRDIEQERKREILRYGSFQDSFVSEGITDETLELLLPKEKALVKERWMHWKEREEPKYSRYLRKGMFVSGDKHGDNKWFEHARSSLEVQWYYAAFESLMRFDYKGYKFRYLVKPGVSSVVSLIHGAGGVIELF